MSDDKTWRGRVGERVVVPRVERADTPWRRMVGLLGRRGLPSGSGLLIRPCRAIHTIGMKFALDVVFLDRSHRVLGVMKGVPPGRWAVGLRGTHSVLECEAGWLRDEIRMGDRLEIEPSRATEP